MPPSSGGLIASLIACGVTGVLLYQQIARPRRDLLMVLILSVVLLSSCYHVFYQARGLYRQKKSQSHDTEFMHRNEETSYEIPHKGENLYCPYCGRAVEDEYEFCNTCGKKLP